MGKTPSLIRGTQRQASSLRGVRRRHRPQYGGSVNGKNREEDHSDRTRTRTRRRGLLTKRGADPGLNGRSALCAVPDAGAGSKGLAIWVSGGGDCGSCELTGTPVIIFERTEKSWDSCRAGEKTAKGHWRAAAQAPSVLLGSGLSRHRNMAVRLITILPRRAPASRRSKRIPIRSYTHPRFDDFLHTLGCKTAVRPVTSDCSTEMQRAAKTSAIPGGIRRKTFAHDSK